MTLDEYYKKKRWEGRPLLFKVKYMYANYPEIAVSVALSFIVAPILFMYRQMTYTGSRYDAIQKYKASYTVVRDDDPNLPKILAEKEVGREHFPKL